MDILSKDTLDLLHELHKDEEFRKKIDELLKQSDSSATLTVHEHESGAKHADGKIVLRRLLA